MSNVYKGKWKDTDVALKVIRGANKESINTELDLLVKLRSYL
jgi:predicted Ser/Thr protein kinase